MDRWPASGDSPPNPGWRIRSSFGEGALGPGAGCQFLNGLPKPLGVARTAQQIGCFLVRREILKRHQHSRRLAALAGDQHGLMIDRHAVQRGGEILAEVAVRGGAHGAIVPNCVQFAIPTTLPLDELLSARQMGKAYRSAIEKIGALDCLWPSVLVAGE